jgi:long-chain acyl-CoA synthetase
VLRIGAEYERALAGAEAAVSIAPVPAEHTLGIFYTGGTTGRAKGVMLSHGNLLANALHVRAVVPFREDDTHLHAAPMFHLADLGYFVVQLVDGGAHAFLPQFRPAALFETMARLRVTTTLLAPTMLALAMADPSYGRHDLSAWRQIEYGGSPIAEPVLKRALAELPCRFYQGYGQTEATHTICTMPHEEHVAAAADPRLLASCGRAIAGVHLRLLDAGDRAVAPGEIGELAARSPTIMTG